MLASAQPWAMCNVFNARGLLKLLIWTRVMRPDRIHCAVCAVRTGSVFCSLRGPLLDKLERKKTTQEYGRGQGIVYEGGPPFAIYCIHSCRVRAPQSHATALRAVWPCLALSGPQ